MTAVFLIINFTLSLFAIFFVIILFLKFSKVQQLEQDYQHLLKEAEDTISSFVLELKEENEAFLSKLSNQSDKEYHFDEQEPELSQEDIHTHFVSDASVITKEPIQSEKDEVALSSYEQVSYLVEKGYSIEEIAKKLNKGKTEIELILKFRQ